MGDTADKHVGMSILLDFYGALLTERQRELLNYYYNDDMSLSEISEVTGITRQGASDAIRKGREQLSEAESKLGLVERFARFKVGLSEIRNGLSALEAEGSDVRHLIEVADSIESEL